MQKLVFADISRIQNLKKHLLVFIEKPKNRKNCLTAKR